MTHREGELFTLKSLEIINQTINQKKLLPLESGGIEITNEPFYKFTNDFIDASTIQNLSKYSGTIPDKLYKNNNAVGFFDSLHDFKSDFIDCQGNMRGISNLWNYKKFGFTFLLHGGYNELLVYENLLIQNAYSYLNRIPRPLNQDNLENYFSIGNIYDIITNINGDKGNIYLLPNTRKNNKNDIYNSLIRLFDNYADSNFKNKIKLIVDYQLNLFDIIQKSRQQINGKGFCILYTSETITDPAPKTKAKKIDEIFGCENWYIENLDTARTYMAQDDNVNGNVNVTFNNININKVEDLENSDFTVQSTYSNENENEVINVKMNSKSNTIQNIKNLIRNTIEKLTNTTDRFNFYNESIKNRIEFYKTFNETTIPTSDAQDYKKKYTRYFARKRLGDTLQGRICLKDKLSQLKFKSVEKIENGRFLTKSSYKLSQQIIEIQDQTTIKDAVLVTHDRMLFSYAVMNKIPTILDLQEHMIVFVPPELQSGGLKRKIEDIPEALPENTVNDKVFDNELNQNVTNIDDNTLLFESIKNNIGDLVHFLYLYKNESKNLFKQNNFGNFIATINNQLQNNLLNYQYLCQYYNNALIIVPKNTLDSKLTEIINEIDVLNDNRPNTRYEDLMYNNLIVYISDSDNNFIKIDKYHTNQNNNWQSYFDIDYIRPSKNKLNYRFYDSDIKSIISKIDSQHNNFNELNEDLVSFYQNYDEAAENDQREEGNENNMITKVGGTINNDDNSISIMIRILLFIIENKSTQLKTVTEENSNILNANFDFLNSKENLFEKNITILYFLFNLLHAYELSFIGYQEGIDNFYTRIDESYNLSDMIGVTNYIPHNIELYVFLKLLLQDYDEDKANKINYSLFEYYLYNLKDTNKIYSRFQDVKSYFLKINYEIEINEDTINLLNTNKETLDYFESITKSAIEKAEQIISENYSAGQNSNFEKIFENASKYNLTLKGYTEMKSVFITKTIPIINNMTNKGLLTQYTHQDDNKNIQNIDTNTREVKPTEELNLYEKAKGINFSGYKKYNPLELENTNAYGAGNIKYFKKTIRNTRKRRNTKKNRKNKNKKTTKNSKRKRSSYKKK
jgi:hypothetical protein